MTRHLTAGRAVAACFVLILAASLTHVAWAFSVLERDTGYWWIVGVVAAMGVDAGLAALTWMAAERRRAGLPTGAHVAGVVLASVVSAFSNLDHAVTMAHPTDALATWASFTALDPWTMTRVILLSVTLPALTVWLAALVEGNRHAGEAKPAAGPVALPAETARVPAAEAGGLAATAPEINRSGAVPTADDVAAAYLREMQARVDAIRPEYSPARWPTPTTVTVGTADGPVYEADPDANLMDAVRSYTAPPNAVMVTMDPPAQSRPVKPPPDDERSRAVRTFFERHPDAQHKEAAAVTGVPASTISRWMAAWRALESEAQS